MDIGELTNKIDINQTIYDLDLLLRAETIKGNPKVGIFPKQLIQNVIDILKTVNPIKEEIKG